jgi:hypothetical protein
MNSLLKNFAILFLNLWILINLLFWFLYNDEISIGDERLLNLKSCPFCFGYSLCQYIQFENSHYDFRFENTDLVPNTYKFQALFNIKNVFNLNEIITKRKLIMKKLAHDSELEEFDANERICSDSCVKRSVLNSNNVDGDFLRKAHEHQGIEVLSCFTDRLAQTLVKNYKEYDFTNQKRNNSIPMLILLSTLKINPEPIILQVVVRWIMYSLF